jgi:hypothetical protein
MRDFASKYKWDIVLLIILALLPLLFFWPLVTPNRADRMAFQRGDFTGQYYPLRHFAARELQAGRLPLWNPYAYCGQPALADVQSAFFYPPNLISALALGWLGLGFPLWALELQAIAHFSLASIFTYLFARRLACKAGAGPSSARFAAAVAAVTFTYSGYLTSFPVQQVTILETAIWLPLLLLFVDVAVDASGSLFRPALLAGGALGLAVLAGHPQTAMYLFWAAAAYTLFGAWGRLGRGLAVLALLVVVGLGLAAVQLLPTLEFIRLSPRAALSYDEVARGLPLPEIAALVFPGYLGGSPQYLGILPLVLIAAALVCGRPRRAIAFWAALGGVAFLLALGGNTFLYPLFYVLLPGFGAVRDQERAFLLFAFAGALLAAYGALVLVRPLPRAERRLLAVLERWLSRFMLAGLIVTALFLYGWMDSLARGADVNVFAGVLRHHVFALFMFAGGLAWLSLRKRRLSRKSWAMALAVALVALNLFTINWRYNLEDPGQKGHFPETGAISFLKAQEAAYGQPFRIASAGLLPGGAGAAAVYALQDTSGNSPLHLASYESFSERVSEWRRWQLLNVHYVLDERDLDGPGLERVHQDGEVRVYRVLDPFPRAWVVGEAEVEADDAAALARLDADDFDLRREALLAQDPPLPLSGPLDGASARVVGFAPTYLALEVETPANGLLLLSEVYYPGWQARVDGSDAPVLRADFLLRAVPVPQGQHRVELFFAPVSLPVGGAISGLVLAGLLVGLLLRRR